MKNTLKNNKHIIRTKTQQHAEIDKKIQELEEGF